MEQDNPEYVLKKDFAIIQGVSGPMVSKYIRTGKIPRGCISADGKKIHVELAQKALAENLHHARRPNQPGNDHTAGTVGKQKPLRNAVSHEQVDDAVGRATKTEPGKIGQISAGMTHAEASRLIAVYKAALSAMDVALRQGAQHDTAECKKQAFEIGRRTRDAVLAVPARICAILAAESDAFQCEKILTAELRDAFQKIIEG